MLQQTRVETVEPYWRRFLRRFPDVASLAAASEDEVLAHWSGLGYYRRARALREAARTLLERHGGAFPRTREELLALPGIGPYTAGAMLSIAFDLPEPLVDGNVERVLARCFAIDEPAASPRLQRAAWELARSLVPARGAGDWNQALMELGALVCTPRDPDCGRCPVDSLCFARERGVSAALPRARRRTAVVEVDLLVLVVRRREAWLMERRPANGPMAGLWHLPTIQLPGERRVERSASRARGAAPRLYRAKLPSGLRPRGGSSGRFARLGEVRHTFTHHRLRAEVAEGRLAGKAAPPLAWIAHAEIERTPLTGMTRKILSAPFLSRMRARSAFARSPDPA